MLSNKTSLQPHHTFSLPASAFRIVIAEAKEQLIAAWYESNQEDQPFLLLGEGSNVLFLEDFNGTVVFNRLKGMTVEENESFWRLHVGAGENWHTLVETTLQQGINGLENLALIPGCVGSAPIQNIGAYGVELKQVCEYVDLLNLTTKTVMRISANDCQFGYRDSIFKHQYKEGYAIIAVGFCLPKVWQPILTYGELQSFDIETVTPQQVFDAVCHMRRTKLPDPAINGNAGSFFKNPIVSRAEADSMLSSHPAMPVYPLSDGTVKLAAGWLIDRCQLKGYRIGGAAVHQNQALVLINQENATPQDVADLAYYVRHRVFDVFGVWLEPEVRFIDAFGEVNAVEYLS
jgi:UDP-N-acetylmuramate dehydrogenase